MNEIKKEGKNKKYERKKNVKEGEIKKEVKEEVCREEMDDRRKRKYLGNVVVENRVEEKKENV